jgi:hypothetical protein
VIVNNFDFNRIRVLPYKADPPLIIDPYAALSAPIASKLLQAVRRRKSQVINDSGCIKHSELTACALLNFRWQAPGTSTTENGLGALLLERFDHGVYYNVMRYMTQCVI